MKTCSATALWRRGVFPLLVVVMVVAGLLRPVMSADPASQPQRPTRPVGFPPPPTMGPSTPSKSSPTSLPEVEVTPIEALEAAQPPGVGAPKLQPVPPSESNDPELRLPGLAGPVGSTPTPSPEVQARFAKYVDQIVDPQNTLDLVVNRNRLMRLKNAPVRAQLTDDTIVTMLTVSPRELSLTGKRVGTTVLTLWFGDVGDPTRQEVLSYLVRVLPDPEYRDRLERVYEALAAEINRAFPDSVVKLQLVGDKLVVSGQAKDIFEAYQILRVVRANAPRQSNPASIPVNQINLNVPADAGMIDPLAPGAVGLANFVLAGGPNIVNMLRVGGEHQVMLKVTVAEVNRAAARSVGINFDIARQDGLVVFANTTGNIVGGGSASGTAGVSLQVSQLANLPVLLGGGQVAAAVNALRTLNLARSLAEPTLTTMNGRPAHFQSGGQFPVPVVTGFTAAGLQGVTFVPYGVSLDFTPVVTDEDRVRLSVNAEVSTRDLSTNQANVNGTSVPSLNTRNFTTTVELRAGETLAVAGLVQNNMGSDATRVPFVGDLPVVGRLFAFDRTANAEQELVVLITPYLVHPLGKGDRKPPLPGADMLPPTDCEFYLLGHLQNQLLEHHRAGEKSLRRRRQSCEQQLLIGPVGYSEAK